MSRTALCSVHVSSATSQQWRHARLIRLWMWNCLTAMSTNENIRTYTFLHIWRIKKKAPMFLIFYRRLVIYLINLKCYLRGNKMWIKTLKAREVISDFYCEDLGYFRNQDLTFVWYDHLYHSSTELLICLICSSISRIECQKIKNLHLQWKGSCLITYKKI